MIVRGRIAAEGSGSILPMFDAQAQTGARSTRSLLPHTLVCLAAVARSCVYGLAVPAVVSSGGAVGVFGDENTTKGWCTLTLESVVSLSVCCLPP